MGVDFYDEDVNFKGRDVDSKGSVGVSSRRHDLAEGTF